MFFQNDSVEDYIPDGVDRSGKQRPPKYEKKPGLLSRKYEVSLCERNMLLPGSPQCMSWGCDEITYCRNRGYCRVEMQLSAS